MALAVSGWCTPLAWLSCGPPQWWSQSANSFLESIPHSHASYHTPLPIRCQCFIVLKVPERYSVFLNVVSHKIRGSKTGPRGPSTARTPRVQHRLFRHLLLDLLVALTQISKPGQKPQVSTISIT